MRLLSLPIDVICECVLPFVSVRDLQILDHAFTNKHLRSRLREVWKSYQFSGVYDSLESLYWMCNVGISIVGMETLSTVVEYSRYNAVFEFISTQLFNLRKLIMRTSSYLPYLTDDALQQLADNCPLLEELHLPSGCYGYGHVGITALAHHCHQLRVLSVSSNNATDASIQSICAGCPRLYRLGVPWCSYLTDASLMAIASTYPHLQSFNMKGCSFFTDDALISFANQCHELQTVIVKRYCNTNRGLTALWAANPNLMHVDINNTYDLADDDILQLLECCPRLRRLHAAHCELITDVAVIAVAEYCPHIESLDVSGCINVSDAALIALAQHSHGLKSLGVSLLMGVTDVGIDALADGCPLLQEIIARGTSITDAAVIALAKRCPQLSLLDVSDCPKLTDAAFIALGQYARGLQCLDRSASPHVTHVGKAALKSGCPLLKEVHEWSASVFAPEAMEKYFRKLRMDISI